MALYQIDTGYACAGIVVENNVVIDAAPIFRWMINKSFTEIQRWKKIKRIKKAKG